MKRLAAIVAVVTLAGCNLQTAGAPKGSLTLVAVFNDAQHLVPGHSVRVADVQVGSVAKIALEGYRARVTMSIANGHRIPVGTTAVLGLTSLLGENYVQLSFPPGFDPRRGPFLKSGAVLTNTTEQPQLEDIAEQAITVLGAVSTGDVTTIVDTLAQAVGGRGLELHQLVVTLSQVGGVYAGQQTNIQAAIDGLAKLGAILATHADELGTLIANLSTATGTLAAQRDRIVATVKQLTRLAQALNDVVLTPHAAQLRTLLSEVAPIVATVAGAKATLDSLITNVATFDLELPKANDNGALLLYAWLSTLILPNGSRVNTSATSGAKAVTALLEPTT